VALGRVRRGKEGLGGARSLRGLKCYSVFAKNVSVLGVVNFNKNPYFD
jgi:hypothetical protein